MAKSAKPEKDLSDRGHYVSCLYCFGAGSLLGVVCEQCGGSGQIWMRSHDDGPDGLDSEECPNCHTVGRVGPSAVGGTHYCYECCHTW